MNKQFVTADTLLEASFALAKHVAVSGWCPEYILGVWRGGAPIGIAMQEWMAYHDINVDHMPIKVKSYMGIGEQGNHIHVEGLEHVAQRLQSIEKLLIVDDIFDSGRSIAALMQAIRDHTGAEVPTQIRVACPWFKPLRNLTALKPDFYLYETDDWIVFPHELCGLTDVEIHQGKGANLVKHLSKGTL